jgi:TolB protein
MKMRIMLVLTAVLIGTPAALYAQETPMPVIPGQIAYIGADYNVYLLAPQENSQLALTDDAGISEDVLRYYQMPTWSTDGRLAYFATAVNRTGEVATEVFVSTNGAAGESIYTGENEVFNYAFWSPQNCSLSETCRDLAVLLGSAEANGLLVELIRSGIEEVTSQVIGTGAPFYYSWSPDGTRMLLQRDGARMDIYDVADDAISGELSQTPGSFFAPAWSPVDDRLLIGVRGDDGESTDLVIVANGEGQTLVEGLGGIAYFNWSPDGNRIAYMDVQNRNRLGTLVVVDAVTGETVAQSRSDAVLAFFWSPNSDQIAYVTTTTASDGSFSAKVQAAQQSSGGLSWSVLDVDNGAVRNYGSFVPTEQMAYLLTYFDQFAQSHRLWSPDSRHLVYSEVTASSEAMISLLDTTQETSVPLFIAEGVVGIWSFN